MKTAHTSICHFSFECRRLSPLLLWICVAVLFAPAMLRAQTLTGTGLNIGSGNYLNAGYSSSISGGSNNNQGYFSLVVGWANNNQPNSNNMLLVGDNNWSMGGSGRSAVFGSSNNFTAMNSVVAGSACVISSAHNSATFGYGLINSFQNSLVVGKYNLETGFTPANPPLFIVGNGTNNTTGRSNAFVVRSNGDVSAKGAIRVNPSGDLGMGAFTSGTAPQ